MTSRVRALLAFLAQQAPTVLVLAGLAGVFVWGSRNEWKLPSPSTWGKQEEKKEEKPGASGDPALVLDDDGAKHAGLEHDPARMQSLSQYVEAPAVLAFDHDLYAQLAPRASGSAWRVLRSLGDPVKKGDLLALVAAPSVGAAKAEFLNAFIQLEIRINVLQRLQAAGDAIPERQVREAELSVREGKVRLVNAQQALVNLGLPVQAEELRNLTDDQVAGKIRLLGLPSFLAGEEKLPGNLLPLTAPFDGRVIRRDMVVGEVVGPTQPVFWIGDVRRLHVEIDARLEDAERLAPGQEVTFRSTATGQSASGKLKFISAEADPKTRTVRAHAEVDNPSGQLRPATFGRAHILVQSNSVGVTVPDNALQWDRGSYRVFVRLNETTYDPRLALLGARAAGRTELLDTRMLLGASLAGSFATPAGPLGRLTSLGVSQRMLLGVQPGEQVVTIGSHVLKSEMLKTQIGGED